MLPLGKDLPFSAPPSPFKLSGTVTFLIPFDPYPVAGTRAVMAQRSLNMACSAPKTLGPGILAASSPNINLSTNMASEAISEHLILKEFSGEACPQTPLARACLRSQHHRCPPNRKYLPPPLRTTVRVPYCARPTNLFWLRHWLVQRLHRWRFIRQFD